MNLSQFNKFVYFRQMTDMSRNLGQSLQQSAIVTPEMDLTRKSNEINSQKYGINYFG
jgi:hypothetical protein